MRFPLKYFYEFALYFRALVDLLLLWAGHLCDTVREQFNQSRRYPRQLAWISENGYSKNVYLRLEFNDIICLL